MASPSHDNTAVSLEIKNPMGEGGSLCRVISLEEAVDLRDQLSDAIRKVRAATEGGSLTADRVRHSKEGS
jgi:hypothetical protein